MEKKRQRFKTNGLVVHAFEGKFMSSEENRLQKKFDRGDITTEELRKLASFIAIHKKSCKEEKQETVIPKTTFRSVEIYFVRCIGRWVEVPKNLYDGYPEDSRKLGTKKLKTLAI